MTTSHPPQDEPPHRAGYVPAFEGADGNEDPAPEAVVHAAPPAPIEAEGNDGRSRVVEEIRLDQRTDADRPAGQLPLDFAESDILPAPIDPAAAITQTIRTGPAADTGAPRHPGDEATPALVQSRDSVCPNCNGSGKTGAGQPCPHCGATGIVPQTVGDA